MLIDILARHRGPYRFSVTRPASKPGFFKEEWLSAIVISEEVGEMALMLLTDPRDTITSVGVYSLRENQYVTTIRGEQDL